MKAHNIDLTFAQKLDASFVGETNGELRVGLFELKQAEVDDMKRRMTLEDKIHVPFEVWDH